MCERMGEALRMNIQTLRVKRCVYRHGDKAPTQTKGPWSQRGGGPHTVSEGPLCSSREEFRGYEGGSASDMRTPPPSSDTLCQKKKWAGVEFPVARRRSSDFEPDLDDERPSE